MRLFLIVFILLSIVGIEQFSFSANSSLEYLGFSLSSLVRVTHCCEIFHCFEKHEDRQKIYGGVMVEWGVSGEEISYL